MRILLLNYEYPPLGGGAGNHTFFHLKEFAKYNDIEIDFITSSTGEYHEEQLSDRIRAYYVNIHKGSTIHYQTNRELLTYSLQAYALAKKLLPIREYNFIHAHFGIPCGFIANKLGLPYIVTLCGSDVPGFNERYKWLDAVLFRRMSKKIWAKAESMIITSQEFKNLALQTSPLQQFRMIPNGVDTEMFVPATSKPNQFTVVSTSRLIPRKGIHLLIDGFAEFNKRYPETKLLIVGDGSQRTNLESQAKSLGLNSISFLGAQNHKDLPAIYQQADVFALPTQKEGMSNAVLEAISSGLAIITTNVGGTAEMVSEKNGIILTKRDAASIDRALETLYNNQKRLEMMKIESRKQAMQFSWGNIGKQYHDLFSDLMNTL